MTAAASGPGVQTTLQQLFLQVALLRKVHEQRKTKATTSSAKSEEDNAAARARQFLIARRSTFV